MMQISFREDSGCKCIVYVEDLSIEQIGKYVSYVEEVLHIPVDTSKLFKKDRRASS